MAVKPAEALRHLGLIDDKSEGRAACEDQPVPPRKAQLVEELPVRARPDPSLLAPGGTRGQHVGRSVDAIHIYPRLQQRRQEALSRTSPREQARRTHEYGACNRPVLPLAPPACRATKPQSAAPYTRLVLSLHAEPSYSYLLCPTSNLTPLTSYLLLLTAHTPSHLP